MWKNEEIGGIFELSSSELYTLFKNSKSEFEKLKVLFSQIRSA
jgi:hypothetical protein